MDIDVTVYCSSNGCGSASLDKDNVYCEDCHQKLLDEISSLENNISELDDRIGELTGQIDEKDRVIAKLEKEE